MTTTGFFARFTGGLAAGLAVAALALAWIEHGGGDARASGVLAAGVAEGKWASPNELRWLRRVGAFESQLMTGLADAQSGASTEGAGITTCARGLRRLAPAPTARMQRPLAVLRRACARLADTGATPDVRDAARLILDADAMLPPAEGRSLPVVGGPSEESRVDPRLSEIASQLAGHSIEVRCWSSHDWTRLVREEGAYTGGRIDGNTLGFAAIGGSRDNLSPAVCQNLASLAYLRAEPQASGAKLLLAAAVVTLSHEPQHSKGITVEAQAECYAIQVSRRTAEDLGASPTYAASLQRIYWAHYGQELPAYRSPECRDGGAYDLDPARTSFP